MFIFKKNFFCELFGNAISRKTGQKCCIYGQNGKPLRKEIIENFLLNMKTNVIVDDMLPEWKKKIKKISWQANEDYTRLYRIFYFKNVFGLTDFIKELYQIDYSSNFHQIPNIHVINKELFKIELYTPLLKGLANRDIQLAFTINTLKFEDYLLYPIEDEKNYRQEIRFIDNSEKESYNGLDLPEGTKLKNKYYALEVNKGCNNPGGCGCKNI